MCRNQGRDIPSCIYEEEHKDHVISKDQQARGTTKVAVLKGDDTCSDFVTVSVYATKLVYCMLMTAEDLRWKVKERTVYDSIKKKEIKMKFLQANIQDNYNQDMNSVDIAY